ncbi:3D domain-containing protein [uncultured Clostridium sp.]|uniref:3D domain-containing protein n=1 Tax=uncultured Clostridium sp. TaxID=59620 RepID=UPI0025EE9732|nr:3D domain-containing protein [uncultured Clostridium sp.]
MLKNYSKYSCFIFNRTSLKLFVGVLFCALMLNFTFANEKVNAVTSSSSVSNTEIVCSSTAYTGGGVTATGISCVRKPFGLSTIAVDPDVIPFYTAVHVEGYGYAIAADCGGAIKGNKIDVYFDTAQDCYNWGVRDVTVTLLGDSTGK